MAVDRATFTGVFTEFDAPQAYPTTAIDFWLTEAAETLPLATLGRQADLCVMLLAAHNLTLGRLSAKGGGVASIAPATSKSAGPVSKTVDIASIVGANAGIYGATSYGVRLLSILQGFVTGGLYRPSRRAAGLDALRYPGLPGGPFGG